VESAKRAIPGDETGDWERYDVSGGTSRTGQREEE